MTETTAAPMGVRVEVWPVAADETGIWLLSSNDAWRTSHITTSSEPHQHVENLLVEHGAFDAAALVHSTSWRMDDESVVLTYIAVIDCPETRAHWPHAAPISLELVRQVGKPIAHNPTDAPVPRYIDVLAHGIRHLTFLLQTDSSARQALNSTWRSHLTEFQPALSGMYEHAN